MGPDLACWLSWLNMGLREGRMEEGLEGRAVGGIGTA